MWKPSVTEGQSGTLSNTQVYVCESCVSLAALHQRLAEYLYPGAVRVRGRHRYPRVVPVMPGLPSSRLHSAEGGGCVCKASRTAYCSQRDGMCTSVHGNQYCVCGRPTLISNIYTQNCHTDMQGPYQSNFTYPIPFDLGSQANLSWSSSGLRNHLRSPSDLVFLPYDKSADVSDAMLDSSGVTIMKREYAPGMWQKTHASAQRLISCLALPEVQESLMHSCTQYLTPSQPQASYIVVHVPRHVKAPCGAA